MLTNLENQPCKNTDRELWRGPDEGGGDYYADSIHVTESGGIGINCGGLVIVMPLREWHRRAAAPPVGEREEGYEHDLLLSMTLTIQGLAKIGKISNAEALAITNKVMARIDEHRAVKRTSLTGENEK